MAKSASALRPPRPAKKSHPIELHGRRWVDEYFWLRDRDNPDVIAHLEDENRHTEAMLKHTESLQEALYQEMRGRIPEDDVSAPVPHDGFFYYRRMEKGRQYAIHCRKRGSLQADEEILLDENKLAEGEPYFRLGALETCPNHRLLAFSTDEEGSEKYTVFVKDLQTGELLPERIPDTFESLEWANDGRTIFYTALDEAHRPYQVKRHELGTPVEDDTVVFHEPDEAFFLHVEKTRSRKYLLVCSSSKTSSEVWFLEADEPLGKLRLIQTRTPKLEYCVDHRGDLFYIVANHQAVNFKLVAAPVQQPELASWMELIPHREDVRLEMVALFQNHMAVFERRNGIRQARVQDLQTGAFRPVEFPESVYTALPGLNLEFDTRQLRLHYTSLVTPASAYDFDMETGDLTLIKQAEVVGGYRSEEYQSQRIEAVAPDGARVPISLVYRKDQKRDDGNPLYLYGYGAYGLSIDPGFNSNRLSLLDRGIVFAIAHIRGGEELGRQWYDSGKLLQKGNSFTDFVACAEALIGAGCTSPEKLVIAGGSAGGLLIGAVVNMRPRLFKAAVAHVPFVDIVNTMLDASLPLTVTEYEEWGNPNSEEFFRCMRSYSPYDNVKAQEYPAMFVTAGLHDPRVSYWEPAKWVARLRDLKTDSNPILLKTNLGAGHGGASGRYDRLKEIAEEYAFLLDRLDLAD